MFRLKNKGDGREGGGWKGRGGGRGEGSITVHHFKT